jgi:hypothetical protein
MPKDWRAVQEDDDEVSLVYAMVNEWDKNSCDICEDFGHKSNRCPYSKDKKNWYPSKSSERIAQ